MLMFKIIIEELPQIYKGHFLETCQFYIPIFLRYHSGFFCIYVYILVFVRICRNFKFEVTKIHLTSTVETCLNKSKE